MLNESMGAVSMGNSGVHSGWLNSRCDHVLTEALCEARGLHGRKPFKLGGDTAG